jgi:small-conductance mechanosensitive channel
VRDGHGACTLALLGRTAHAIDGVAAQVVAMNIPATLEEILFDPTVGKIVATLVGILVIFALRRVVRRSVSSRVDDNTTRYRTRKLIDFASYMVVALFIGTVYSDKLGGFTVAFGVAGAGVAFALQEVIGSAAGWIALSFGGFYSVGDRVMLGGIKGDVIDIGILRTTVFQIGDWVDSDNYNGRVVRIANSFVFKEPVFNYSADFPFLWDEIKIPIRHGSDRGAARRILEEVAEELVGDYARDVQSTWDDMQRKYVIEKARLQPFVTMVMDASWMTYTVRYVVEFKNRLRTKDQLFARVLDRIDETPGVGIASAAQEITLMKPSQVRVDVDRSLGV